MSYSDRPLSKPPEASEIEVSLFGPGYGESVVVHLGNGDWMVVDSCIDAATQTPAALRYFEQLSIDPAQAVRIVVATHWDSDHIKGLANLFRQCDRAKFHCTAAFDEDSFLACLGAWHGDPESGIDELVDVLNELKRRSSGSNYIAPECASENKILWERQDNPAVEIRALSPSSPGILAPVAKLRQFQSGPGKVRRRLPRITNNHASVVLRVRIKDFSALLGGDLQVRSDNSFGWKAVLRSFGTGGYTSETFKVPHHGSANADHDDIWSQMLSPDPFALVAPFVGGGSNLPTLNDCHRLQNRTENAYITAPPVAARYRDPNPAVQRTMREATRAVRSVPSKFGHVRLRKTLGSNDPARIQTFGDAMSMNSCIDFLQNTPNL